jgi:phage terminase small subunit
MPRGGARPGAGRKPNPDTKKAATGFTAGGKKTKDAPPNWPFGTAEPPAASAPAPEAPDDTEPVIAGGEPLEFLQSVINDTGLKLAVRMAAAIAAAPYKHPKALPAKQEPKAPTKSKFGVRSGPRLAVSNE